MNKEDTATAGARVLAASPEPRRRKPLHEFGLSVSLSRRILESNGIFEEQNMCQHSSDMSSDSKFNVKREEIY